MVSSNRSHIFGSVTPGEDPYNVLVHTLAQTPLLRAALPELLVAPVEAIEVLAELSQAVRVDVREPTPRACQHFEIRPQETPK